MADTLAGARPVAKGNLPAPMLALNNVEVIYDHVILVLKGVSLAVPKGAIVALTRAMASHHGRDGIRVNCIAPGTVYTPMVASRGMTPELRQARRERTLLGTEGTGWDIGYGALYLASDESRWVTGITLPIDGGATAGAKSSPVPPSEPEKA